MSFYAHQSNESGEFSMRFHPDESTLLQQASSRSSSGKPPPLMSLGASPSSVPLVVDGENRTKLIVNYLPQTMQDVELWDIFSGCGEVISAKIIRDLSTQYSYGYGFVEFTRPEDAARAILNLKGYPIQNKRLGVAYARVHDREDLKNTNLYIANLPSAYTNESALRDVFSRFGKIINLKILRDDRSRQIRSTAFVRFDRKQEAEEAIRQLNGKALPGAAEPLVVKVSEEHGKQKAVAHAPKAYQSQSYGGYSDYRDTSSYRQSSHGYTDLGNGSNHRLPSYGYDDQEWGGGKSGSTWNGGGYRRDDHGPQGGRRDRGHGQYDRKGGRFGGGGYFY